MNVGTLLRLKSIYTKLPRFVQKPINNVIYRQSIKKSHNTFLTKEEQADERLKKEIVSDIKQCRRLYNTKAEEYFLFGFRNLTPSQRDEFLPDWVRDTVMHKIVGLDVFTREIRNKYNFYQLLGQYFKRNVFLLPSGGGKYDDFERFALENRHLFMKRNSSSRGRGIRCCEVQTKEEVRKV